jgi:hypothetical protein
VLKKACELSILCDTDVAIIAFSPTGELLYYCNTRYDVRVCICTQEEEEYLHFMSCQKLKMLKIASYERKKLVEVELRTFISILTT